MQFVVLVAFAMVFMPAATPPWPVLEKPVAVFLVVIGQVVVIAAWAAAAGRAVVRQLDRDPTRPGLAQRRHSRDSATLSSLLLAGLVAGLWGTTWPMIVRRQWGLDGMYGVDDLVILTPFFAAMIVAWIAMFPADRAIRQVTMEANLWEGLPVRPPWGLGAYLLFLLRHQLLIVALPMLVICVANDCVQQHARYLRKVTRLYWADQAVLVGVAGLILFFAPILLRVIWSTSVLPDGPLRRRLVGLSERLGLRFREILIWHSEGMVVNAAVMGVLPPVRYVLLSDGLLETMEDEKIEAVFGHEAGHVRHLHIPFYILFALASMLAVGGVCELLFRVLRFDASYATALAVVLITAIWGIFFGWISRRFERQADLFGARTVAPGEDGCILPCRVHHRTASAGVLAGATDGSSPARPAEESGQRGAALREAICATGAKTFGEALRQIARLNGIPAEARSWRHSSIASRIRFLQRLADNPDEIRRFGRTIVAIKVVLAVGSAVGTAAAVWLYWDYL